MVFIAFFSMTAKFVSCTLGQMYRKVNPDGSISGGPMYYLSEGLKERGFTSLGKFLGGMYAVFIIGGAFILLYIPLYRWVWSFFTFDKEVYILLEKISFNFLDNFILYC